MDLVTEYRILGRFRKDTKFHMVGGGPLDRITDKAAAEARLQEIMDRAEREMLSRKRTADKTGKVGISTEYYSEYDLVEFKIQSRQLTPWHDE